jgi:hypothetical protein
VIRPGHHLKPWGQFGGLGHKLKSIALESDGGRGFVKDAPVTSGGDHALRAISGDDDPRVFSGNVLHTKVANSALVTSGGLIMSGGGTVASGSIYEMGSNEVAREGIDDSSVLLKVACKGDDTLHMNDTSDKHSPGNDDILAVGEGNDMLPVDDDSSTR